MIVLPTQNMWQVRYTRQVSLPHFRHVLYVVVYFKAQKVFVPYTVLLSSKVAAQYYDAFSLQGQAVYRYIAYVLPM